MQSLIRTAEQLKIKGLCEINDHTNAAESDNEVIYPPHKKIRASRNYDNNNSLNSNKNLSAREEFQPSSAKTSDKDAQPSVASNEEHSSKHKTKSPSKETKSASSHSSSKNMASLEMGMVSSTIMRARGRL